MASEYVFRYISGAEDKFEDEAACLASIEANTGLDETMARICLNRDGITHPTGKWLKRPSPQSAAPTNL
jgi:hypothetical protein